MKRAVDLAIEHAGNMVAGYKIEVVNLDDASRSPVVGMVPSKLRMPKGHRRRRCHGLYRYIQSGAAEGQHAYHQQGRYGTR